MVAITARDGSRLRPGVTPAMSVAMTSEPERARALVSAVGRLVRSAKPVRGIRVDFIAEAIAQYADMLYLHFHHVARLEVAGLVAAAYGLADGTVAHCSAHEDVTRYYAAVARSALHEVAPGRGRR
jgi:hypothetical protein